MTEAQHERELARHEVDEAMEKAKSIHTRGAKIADGWQRSRQDNNFRQMIRALGQRITNASGTAG